MTHLHHNWAGNYTFRAARFHQPETLAQLQALVCRSHKLRVLGARHSFNAIADTSDDLVSLDAMPPVMELDRARSTVTVGAAVRYGQLCRFLHGEGFALHNLASLPHISIAGACATATHGSGDRNANLATAVEALELVDASGELIRLSRAAHGAQFDGMVVALGALGVVTTLTLTVQPAYEVSQVVYRNLPLATVAANLDAVTGSAYSVSLFTDWQHANFNQLWLKRRVVTGEAPDAAPHLFGATLAGTPLHPIETISPASCTEQMGVPGPWHERLTHFRMEHTPSAGDELQTEYFVPRAHAVAAFHAIDRLKARIAPVLHISEIRTIAADALWLSPCYQRDCVAIHFTWKNDWEGVRQLLPIIEESLAPFNARPHWGKLFTVSPARLRELYPKLWEFRALVEQYDPTGKFRNPFVEVNLFGRV